MKKQFRMTKEGIAELQHEHDELVAKRGELADAIKTAREQGDLSENAEYHAAKDEQEKSESRIAELDFILQNVEVISKPRSTTNVKLGNTVKLKSKGGGEKTFQVVGTVEADPLNGKISDESPIGRALIGKKVGDSVEIKTPVETNKYIVADIA